MHYGRTHFKLIKNKCICIPEYLHYILILMSSHIFIKWYNFYLPALGIVFEMVIMYNNQNFYLELILITFLDKK